MGRTPRGAQSDLEPLTELVSLKTLDLGFNEISDLTPLSGLTNLEYLGLSLNDISDLRPIADLIALKHLQASDNTISDLKPLTGLINLELLMLDYNPFGDIPPLVANEGLGQGDELYIGGSYLDCEDPDTKSHLQTLEARGAALYDNCR